MKIINVEGETLNRKFTNLVYKDQPLYMVLAKETFDSVDLIEQTCTATRKYQLQ